MSWARHGAAALLFLLFLCFAAPSARAIDWLVFVVDRSNSVDREELALQRRAYVDVLRDELILWLLQDTQVAIVEFDSTADVVVPWSNPQDAAESYDGWSPAGPRGGTGIGQGLRLAMDLLAGKQGRRIIDVSGDGRENRDLRLLREMREEALKTGVEVNGLVIRNRALGELDAYYRERVANGFVIHVDDRADFFGALRYKIGREIRISGPKDLEGDPDAEMIEEKLKKEVEKATFGVFPLEK